MIIQCESCKTKFKLDEMRLKGPSSRVRCTRCGHVFRVEAPPEAETFHVELSDEPLPEEEERGPVEQPTPSPVSPPPGRISKRTSRQWPLLAVTGLILVAILGFWLLRQGFFSSSATSKPKAPSSEVQQPVVTIMDNTQAYFLENSQAGQIFIVEGEVMNESARPVSFVMVEGRLYSKNNQVAQSQRCYAGNFMTRDELVKLGMNDIQNRMMNREGKELSNVHIPVSKKIPFMLVFHNLPELDSLADYSVEVVSAKFE